MWEWLVGLFDTTGFPARWSCGVWPEWLGWLHIVSDLTTFAAYTAIPCILLGFIVRRRDVPFPRVFWLFAAFIFACGSVHLVESVIFWQPIYRFSGVLKGLTAVVSVGTAVALVPTTRRALRLPGFHATTARLAAIVSASGDAIISTGLDGTIQSWNKAAEQMHGQAADAMIGTPITSLVPPERRSELAAVHARVRHGGSVQHFETEHLTKSGARIPVSLNISPLLDTAGHPVGLSAIARDISVSKSAERELKATASRLERVNRRLRELADRDPLTGLLNRRGFEAALAVEVERMRRHGTRAAVILIDCDDFKAINDRLGHQGGDEVLREIGDRIEDAAREPDQIARIGGDEFMVLTVDTRVSEAMQVAHRIRRAVADRVVRTSLGEIDVGISCGVEALESDRRTFEALFGRTSAALKRAKNAGKNTVTAGGGSAGELTTLPGPDDIEAVAQAIVEVSTQRVAGYEFLARGPVGPLRSPAHLFAAHRESDTLTAIDLACIERCFSAASGVAEDLRVHVNVFPSTLLADLDNLMRHVQVATHPERVYLEVNEAMLIGDPAQLVSRTRAIRSETACRLAVDNVGFGRSSLEALILLEPEVVKVDRHFVAGISADAGVRRRLQRLVQVARSLDAEIIAEGVESDPDRVVLEGMGIGLAQGYLWGRPARLN